VFKAAGLLAVLVAGACGRPREQARPFVPPPPIGHVFVIVLENEDYETTFGSGSAAPYLADTLVAAGALLRQYYGIGHYSLDNYIAMISGIAPDHETQEDCETYGEFIETGVAPDGQPIGRGCVYPAHVPTIANQLAARQRTWKGYLEDMGRDPRREASTCGHPSIGARDATQQASPRDQYATKHDPFVYFHAILDSSSCGTNVVELARLESDLRVADSTPSFSFIVPNLCHDGHDHSCANGERGGLAAADRFLAAWVPRITQAPAFRDGLLIVVFDEAGSDASACCDEIPGPNAEHPGVAGPGGGRTGAVLLSPFIAPGTVSDEPYNHYALLRSLEDVFGLPYLGYAGRPGLAAFGSDVYSRRGSNASVGRHQATDPALR
jgi:phosphatidylinositol-3-phosphatase